MELRLPCRQVKRRRCGCQSVTRDCHFHVMYDAPFSSRRYAFCSCSPLPYMHKDHSTDTPATESAQVLQHGSPHLKRRRSSSPSCDYFWDDLSQGDLESLDKLEAEFNHVSNNRGQPEKEEKLRLIEQAQRLGEAGHPTATNSPSIPSSGLDDALGRSAKPVGDVATRSIPMFTSALNAISSLPSASSVHSRSPSPEIIPEQDYSSWFSPDDDS